MNIFIRELKIKRKSIIVWGLSISAFLIFYMAFYPSISREAEAFINILIVNLVTLEILILSSYRYLKDENFYIFIALLFIAIFLLQMIFLSIGILIASITKRYRKSGNISVGILIISYVLAFLKNMINKWDFLNYITPFKYFDSNTILSENILEIKFIILAIIIIAFGIGITFYSYPKRDLQI